MSGRTFSWTVTPTGATAALPVVGGGITVDGTRNPQVEARVTVPHTSYAETNRFDPFTRAEVVLEVRSTTHVGGTLATYGQGTTPGTLGTLDWSSKAAPTSRLGTAIPSTANRRLRLYVTDLTINETAGTAEVSLVSADYLLTEMVNFGPAWTPRPSGMTPGSPQGESVTHVNRAWAEFIRTFGLPIAANETVSQGGVFDVGAWETGQNAFSYLNNIRLAAEGWRYVLNTAANRIDFMSNFGETPATLTTSRALATNIDVKRSVENSGEGVNVYADGVAVKLTHYSDPDAPTLWQFATVSGDWRLNRRPYVEEQNYFGNTAGTYDYATTRLGRTQKWKRLTTLTIPNDPNAMPFRDLSDHPLRTSIQSINYDYASGDVTTTFLEAD